MKTKHIIALLVLATAATSCYKEEVVWAGDGLEDWSVSTHSSSAIPNYDVVFPQDAVNRIDIVIEADDWATMESDLASLTGGSSGGPGGSFSDENPVTVPCQFYFNDLQWYHVGIRYKGNSSLYGAAGQGKGKLPFRLDFNEYEDTYPEIDGQTFYGFQEMSLSSNYEDGSMLREKLGPDVFRSAGVPAPMTAFYRVYVDYGDGPVYFGLYTNVEVVFDTFIADQYGSNTGNCYKPDGDAASWASGSYNTGELENKTNDFGDWSDCQALYDILHDGSRTTDPETWKDNLESVFNVDRFLNYLAVNTTIQNWDTYGRMTHNYYLYNDPTTGKLNWIPWDNNEAFQLGKQGGSLSFEFTEVNDDWPLIDYLMAQSEYRATFDTHVQNVIDGAFNPTDMQNTYQYYHDLIEPYVTGSEGESSTYSFTSSGDFAAGLTELKSHVSDRHDDATDYLN